MAEHQQKERLALLIDADNAQASLCSDLLAEVAKFGVVTVRRAYGDWTRENLRGWKEHLHRHAIQPIQQFAYTKGKNATDSSLIIDAMDLLHKERLDGFCIVSSDSDFTRLATRIREDGLVVYGFGEQKTPEAFVAACDRFVYTELLRAGSTGQFDAQTSHPASVAVPSQVGGIGHDGATSETQELIGQAVDAVSSEDGWAHLAEVGSYLTKNDPSFDSRRYGFAKLSQLVKSLPGFQIEERRVGTVASATSVYVRRWA